MQAEWIAAGFPRCDFWLQTPRSFDRIMGASRRRARDQMILTARAVWVAMRASHSELAEWERDVLDPPQPLPPEALQGALERASAGLPVTTWEEVIKEMEKR